MSKLSSMQMLSEQLKNESKLSNVERDWADCMLSTSAIVENKYLQLEQDYQKMIAKKVWSDIFNNNTLTYDNFEDYYNNELLKK
jgi:hypothetical protein